MKSLNHRTIMFLTVFLIVPFTSCFYAQELSFGDSLSLGEGTVRAWVELDEEGLPINIGTTLTKGALSNLPTGVGQWSLDLPAVASDLLFDHVLFDWNPYGHPPRIYTEPHFDFHFVIVSREEREAVRPGFDDVPVESRFIPTDYAPDYDLPLAIANMGVHYVDLAAPEWNGQTFTETFIYGFYDGKLIFVEPMIALAYFQTKPDDTFAIKQPNAFQRTGYYPTSYRIYYDATKQEYNVVITDFILRQGTPTSVD